MTINHVAMQTNNIHPSIHPSNQLSADQVEPHFHFHSGFVTTQTFYSGALFGPKTLSTQILMLLDFRGLTLMRVADVKLPGIRAPGEGSTSDYLARVHKCGLLWKTEVAAQTRAGGHTLTEASIWKDLAK